MNRKDIKNQLIKNNIQFSNKDNSKRLFRKLQKFQQLTISYGVKAFRKLPDGTLQTGGIGGSDYTEFQVGGIYSLNNSRPLELCQNGFHFFRENEACFGVDFFNDSETVLHRIKVYGETVCDTYKMCCRKFEILEEISPDIDKNSNSGHSNSGNSNSGDYNSGNSNSGNYNSGYCNSGNYNSGYCNSGHWNSCDFESGSFNIKTPDFINVFGRKCSRTKWENSKKPKFLYFEIQNGETYKQAFQRSWDNTTPEDRKLLESLPNFDWKIFTQISGIKKPKK